MSLAGSHPWFRYQDCYTPLYRQEPSTSEVTSCKLLIKCISAHRSYLDMSMKEVYKFFMTTKPIVEFVFEPASASNTYGVPTWAKHIIDNLVKAQGCLVLSVDHRKAHTGMEHERLHIRLFHPPCYSTYMIAERFADIGTNSSSTLAVPSLFAPTHASDTVRFANEPDDSYYSLNRWTFEGRQPSMVDLCAIIYAVSKRGEIYGAYKHQCFWFSGVVYGVLKEEFVGMEFVGEYRRRGTYGKIRMPSADTAEDVEFIRGSYMQTWQDLIDETAPERAARLEQASAEARQRAYEEGRREGRAERDAEIIELRRLQAIQE